MACAWLEAGREIESIDQHGKANEDIIQKFNSIAKRAKPKFDF